MEDRITRDVKLFLIKKKHPLVFVIFCNRMRFILFRLTAKVISIKFSFLYNMITRTNKIYIYLLNHLTFFSFLLLFVRNPFLIIINLSLCNRLSFSLQVNSRETRDMRFKCDVLRPVARISDVSKENSRVLDSIMYNEPRNIRNECR